VIPTLFGALVVLLGQITGAGSIYVNHPSLLTGDDEGQVLDETARGFNAEAAFKLAADVSPNVSANAKVCFGCHGFHADMAYFDWHVADEFNVRAGRFPVPFGEFYLRHDPANHRAATKPLPYTMGRMLRRKQFNLAVAPQPYPDNGVELFGTLRTGGPELSYSAYAVGGLKGESGELDYIRSRSEYFTDNNRTPTMGGRLVAAFPDLPVHMLRWVAIGFSGLYGKYDDEGDLASWMVGADLYVRYGKLNVIAEVMSRRTEIPDRPDLFQQELVDLWNQRDGFYVQTDGPVSRYVEWLFRFDGFRRRGPVLLGVDLDDESSILRYTFGLNLIPTTGVKVKANYELWAFDDFPAEHIVHTGLVGTF
jgi:hypothetical protein